MKPPTMDDVVSMFQASGLKAKLLFTFAMIVIFRLGVALPLYGVNNEVISNLARQGNLIGFIDLFSGGALANVSILALGIGPYITASIIMQLLTVIIPHLEQLQKEEGEARKTKNISIYKIFYCIYCVLSGNNILALSFASNKQRTSSRCVSDCIFHRFCNYFDSRFGFCNVAC